MRKLFLMTIGAAALLVSGASAAIPITTTLTLSDPTGGQGLCEVDCVGTITIEVTSGPITNATNGIFDITGLDIEITSGNPAISTGLTFGNLSAGFNKAQIVNGTFTDFYAVSSTDINGNGGFLHITGKDWGIAAPFVISGGSGSAIGAVPEPSALALLGIGLLGFGAATRRKRRNIS